MNKFLSNQVDKKVFEGTIANETNSKFGSGEIGYQKATKRLARVLKNDIKILETPARINYLVEKIFSVKRSDKLGAFVGEEINKEDYDFVLGLSTKDLKKFHSKIKNRVLKCRQYLRERDNGDELPDDYSKYLGQFDFGNQMLRFISQIRNDVHSETFRVLDFGIDQKMSESLTDEMKSIYPNREEMVAKAKEENVEQTPLEEKEVENEEK